MGVSNECGASLSVNYKLKKEKNYLDDIIKYNPKKNTNNFLSPKSTQSFISSYGNNSSNKKKVLQIKRKKSKILWTKSNILQIKSKILQLKCK